MNNQRMAVAAFAFSALAFVGLTTSESYRPVAYMPTPNDVPTIGFGTTAGVKMGDTITVPKALARALTDISKYEGAVKQCVKVPLHQYEYDAFVSLAYNTGADAFCRSTLVKRLNTGDYTGACTAILQWNKQWNGKYDARGKKIMVVLGGLTKRRETEYKQCMGV